MPIMPLTAPFVSLALLGSAAAVGTDERVADVIHADLPLFGENDAKHPAPFSEGEGENYSCGYGSRVRWGDWKFTDPQDPEAGHWYRFTNYGVFHCYAITRDASDRDQLKDSRFEYSFFVPVGRTRVGGRPIELWAMQIGSRPGSSYHLLAR
ncbi:hypothetical protein [Sphingomonas turrisvirgatae]|uniref:YHS domain-containing protein n=1 Tax=Sphingomonas turrisvirgatae TaxID=1888892 RepID=A0A1E3LUG5_9SPHN|nr:hypothetical protein [Sphingomonas turrisvirgatae]ODP37407.1 hypothetical protein BFL28_18215 [Sphingomonas turrisvirgatae]